MGSQNPYSFSLQDRRIGAPVSFLAPAPQSACPAGYVHLTLCFDFDFMGEQYSFLYTANKVMFQQGEKFVYFLALLIITSLAFVRTGAWCTAAVQISMEP